MHITPTQTAGAKRTLVREGEEDVKSLKKSSVARGDEQTPPSVSAFIKLRGGDMVTDPLAVAVGHPC